MLDENMKEIMFDLICGRERPESVTDEDALYLFEALASQGISAALYREIEAWDFSAPIMELYRTRCEGFVRNNYRLWFETRALVNLFLENEIPCVVLKGPVTAVCYPIPEHRKSGDIDILVPESYIDKAVSAAASRGYAGSKESYAIHEVGMYSPEGIVLEIHKFFADEWSDPEVNEFIKEIRMPAISTAVEVDIMPGMRLPGLREDYHAFYLLIHMVNHFVRKGFDLKLLMDWKCFFSTEFPDDLKDSLMGMIKRGKMSTFTSAVTLICVKKMGLDRENCEFLISEEVSDEILESFLDEIIDSQISGVKDSSRMIAAESDSLWGLFKAFHGEMVRQHRKAARCFLFWPVLWVMTYVNFLRNNKKYNRNTSTAQVIKSSRERSRYRKQLKLFEK
ncbi:MAG: nucleotidyltransferase family protein [Eubacterium sp.]|nr:nucleotidyltransferase family protein [Eubacterium sp.]